MFAYYIMCLLSYAVLCVEEFREHHTLEILLCTEALLNCHCGINESLCQLPFLPLLR